MYKFIIATLFFVPFFCKAQSTSSPIVDSVKTYLDKSLEIIQANALNSNKINWSKLHKDVYEKASGATRYEDILSIYPYIFEQIDDHHGSLKYKGKTYGWNKQASVKVSNVISAATDKYVKVDAKVIGKDIGYILVPGNSDFGGKKMDSIIRNIKQAIARVHNKKIKGWILDLRVNTGGNMYPMIAGLTELIGDGNVGRFVTPSNKSEGEWIIKNNMFFVDTNKVSSIAYNGYRIKQDIPLAVLISGNTASSGEMTAITTVGRKNSILIGEPSANYTTINQGFKLNAYSGLNLAVNYVSDRNGKVYYKQIEPDKLVKNGDNFEVLSADNKVKDAIIWIRKIK